MKFVYPNLTRAMSENNISSSDLAEYLGLTYMATYRRLRGITSWKLAEVVKICDLLNDPRVDVLFLRLDTN